MNNFSRIGANGSLRINTRAMQPRTSSNSSFQEHIRSGIGGGIKMTNNALRHVGPYVPGTPALSSALSDAARNLASPGSLDGVASSTSAEGDMGSLQSDMLRNNQEMLEQQVRVSRITTEYSTRSYILKAMFDSLKTIGSNIR